MKALAASSIRTVRRSLCMLCGHAGHALYAHLQDRLFGVAGAWSLSRCPQPDCGLVWLDPMPVVDDLATAYETYYTHFDEPSDGPKRSWRQAYHFIKRDYIAYRYGYRYGAGEKAWSGFGLLLYLFPIRRGEVDQELRHLHACPGGRLLDVGCGSGGWLATMRDLGWRVRGVDFDATAVAVAAGRGLRVDHGTLESQDYPGESFDGITLNHVIEHLPDPCGTLAECRRILKQDGQLTLFTPNSASLGHLFFKQNWRGLEPPRHLYLFCPNAMRAALRRAGFGRSAVHTTNSRYILEHSLSLQAGRTNLGKRATSGQRLAALLLAVAEQAALCVRPGVGECLAIQAHKM
jgi:SAM-dependent methyltransferase